MNLVDLNTGTVRQFMVEEFESDLAAEKVYMSPRLTEAGAAAYPQMLRLALAEGTPQSFEAALRRNGILRLKELRQLKKGPILADVPYTAAETLAQGEFNRYYCRGLCRHVVDSAAAVAQAVEATVEVYRAMEVTVPRSASVALIGTRVNAEKLLADLRVHIGVDTALGVPAGPNSGLSVKT